MIRLLRRAARCLSLVALLATTTTLMVSTTGPAPAAFATDSVQAQIDAQLAAVPGGVQVSPNEIAYDDGNVIMVFPTADGVLPTSGDTRIEIAINSTSGTSFMYGCPYGTYVRWYCFYEHRDFGGRMLQFKDCASHPGLYQRFTDWGFNDQTSSWVNTSSRKVYVYDNLGPTVLLWGELGRSANSWVGSAYNDRASAFLTEC